MLMQNYFENGLRSARLWLVFMWGLDCFSVVVDFKPICGFVNVSLEVLSSFLSAASPRLIGINLRVFIPHTRPLPPHHRNLKYVFLRSFVHLLYRTRSLKSSFIVV